MHLLETSRCQDHGLDLNWLVTLVIQYIPGRPWADIFSGSELFGGILHALFLFPLVDLALSLTPLTANGVHA